MQWCFARLSMTMLVMVIVGEPALIASEHLHRFRWSVSSGDSDNVDDDCGDDEGDSEVYIGDDEYDVYDDDISGILVWCGMERKTLRNIVTTTTTTITIITTITITPITIIITAIIIATIALV